MLEEFNIYKEKIKNILKNKQYSKRTPLNSYTSKEILKNFNFNSKTTYIEIHTLNKKDKNSIIDEFLEFIKIKDYKNYFDITFKLDENDIKTILDTIDKYQPESITIYEIDNNKEFEKYLKNGSKILEICTYIIILNFEEQTIKINYDKKNKNISTQIKKIKKYFE